MNKNTNQPIGSTCDDTVFVGTPKNQTLKEHLNNWTKTSVAHTQADKLTVECFVEHLERENFVKAILLKERQRITTIIDSIEEFDEPSCLADESLLLAIKREIKDKVNL